MPNQGAQTGLAMKADVDWKTAKKYLEAEKIPSDIGDNSVLPRAGILLSGVHIRSRVSTRQIPANEKGEETT